MHDDDTIITDFKRALRGVASTVSVITAHDGLRHHGMTVTSVTSLSMDPPSLLVCLHQASLLHDIVRRSSDFCVNVLDESHERISAAFSGAIPPEERFTAGDWAYRDDGLSYLSDAQASIFCTKAAALPYGTHTIIVGKVTQVRLSERQRPLIYQNASYCSSAPRAPLA